MFMKQFFKPITTTLLLLLSLFSAGRARAQEAVSAQTFGLEKQELAAILQKCVDLPALQKYYPVNADRSVKSLSILQMPIAFPADLALAKGGAPVRLVNVSKAEYRRLTTDAYAMFRTIAHTGNTVRVNFNYFYHAAGSELKNVFVAVDFQKSGARWNVVTSSVKE